jgi:endonuclease/exonuclease/phosphatase family metal-dependent hydrolase
VGRPGDPGPTILPRRIDRPPRRRIDFIWATAAIEVVAAEVPRFGTPDYETFYRLSDHLPLTVTLDLPD